MIHSLFPLSMLLTGGCCLVVYDLACKKVVAKPTVPLYLSNLMRAKGDPGDKLRAEDIDKHMLIDTHYGAIASKAVKLQPNQLNAPEKGKSQFEELLGESWGSAIAANKVYNAKDACERWP
jgi:hypothetical protein